MVLINSFFLDTTFLLRKLISSLSSPLLEECEGLSLSRALVAELARQGQSTWILGCRTSAAHSGVLSRVVKCLRVCQSCLFAGTSTRTVRAARGAALS